MRRRQRPLGMVQQLFGMARSLITFLSMIALMARLGWIVGAVALIAPIPSFIASSRYGWRGYWLARRQSPDRRRMSYFLDLLTKDTYNKEIKLFGLGGHFIDRWKEIADRFYRENQALLHAPLPDGLPLGQPDHAGDQRHVPLCRAAGHRAPADARAT